MEEAQSLKQLDIAIPAFGYKNHASIDRRHGFIRGWNVTAASAYDGAQLRNVLNRGNTGSTVWADTAYRSKTNEAWLEKNGMHPVGTAGGADFVAGSSDAIELIVYNFAKSLDAVVGEGGGVASVDIVDPKHSVFRLELIEQVP